MNQPRHITDIFWLKNSATPPRAVTLRPCEAPSIRFSPRRASADTKEKMSLALLIFAGVIFSKMERPFFFLGFCPPSIRAGGGASIRTRFCKNYFLGRNFPFAPLFGFGEIRA